MNLHDKVKPKYTDHEILLAWLRHTRIDNCGRYIGPDGQIWLANSNLRSAYNGVIERYHTQPDRADALTFQEAMHWFRTANPQIDREALDRRR